MNAPRGGAFRRVDVDQFAEEKFGEEEAEASGTTNGGVAREEEGGPSESDVLELLSQNRSLDALHYVLGFPPIRTKNQALKNRVVELVMRVMMTFRSGTDIEEALRSLDQQRLDLVMKYIYRGFEFPTPDGSSAHLLLWHEKVFAFGGMGCIVRVLTDQKRL